MTLRARGLSLEGTRRPRLNDVDVDLTPGRLVVLLGPNGAGKSSLIAALAGDIAALGERVSLDGRALSKWPRSALARRRAVLRQHETLDFDFRVDEMIALGRMPWPVRHRDAAVDAAITALTLQPLRYAAYPTLSSGERARVRLARVLAQIWNVDDACLLLDEPVAHLDLAAQRQCLTHLRTLADRGVTVVAALHDPALAARYADDVVLLREGCVLAAGPVDTVLTAQRLTALYDVAIVEGRTGDGQRLFALDR